VSGWHPHYSSGACDAIQWSNLTFHYLIKRTTMSSFIWCGAWQHMVVGLSPMVIFSFFFSLLVSPLSSKMHDCLFFFSISILILLSSYFFIPLIKFYFFFNLIFQLQFLICFVFSFWLIFFWFLIVFPWLFC